MEIPDYIGRHTQGSQQSVAGLLLPVDGGPMPAVHTAFKVEPCMLCCVLQARLDRAVCCVAHAVLQRCAHRERGRQGVKGSGHDLASHQATHQQPSSACDAPGMEVAIHETPAARGVAVSVC
jgi:hypothetical protein